MASMPATSAGRGIPPERDQPRVIRQPLLRSSADFGCDRPGAADPDMVAAMKRITQQHSSPLPRRQRRRPARAVTLHADLRQHVAAPAAIRSSLVQTSCPERALSPTGQALAGGRAPDRGAQPGRRGPEVLGGFEAEGKIKGRGTCARRKPCLHVGWRGTRLKCPCAAPGAKGSSLLAILRAACAVTRQDALELLT